MVKKKMSFRDLLSRVSGSPFVWRSGAICTILVESIMKNSFEIILHLDQWFRCFLSRTLAQEEPFVPFW